MEESENKHTDEELITKVIMNEAGDEVWFSCSKCTWIGNTKQTAKAHEKTDCTWKSDAHREAFDIQW